MIRFVRLTFVTAIFLSLINLCWAQVEQQDKVEVVYFDNNHFLLSSNGKATLNAVIRKLKADGFEQINVSGHADSDGSDVLNERLALNRAYSVFNYFSSKGIARNKIKVKGFGEHKPVGSNSTESGKQKNRRVEIKITFIKVTEIDKTVEVDEVAEPEKTKEMERTVEVDHVVETMEPKDVKKAEAIDDVVETVDAQEVEGNVEVDIFEEAVESKELEEAVEEVNSKPESEPEIEPEPEPEPEMKEISGELVDAETSKALAFANVEVEGAKVGTSTDAKGWFSLSVPIKYASSNLLVSHIGYEPQIIPIESFKGGILKSVKKKEEVCVHEGFPNNVYLCDDQYKDLYHCGQILPMNAKNKSCFGTFKNEVFDNCKGKNIYSFDMDCGLSVDPKAVKCGGEYTIEMYFKMDKNKLDWNRLIAWGSGSGDHGLYLVPRQKCFDFWDSRSIRLGKYDLDEWTYVAVTREKSGMFTLWVNGELVRTFRDMNKRACGKVLVFFADVGGGASGEAFSGQVAYISVSKGVIEKELVVKRNDCMPCCECSDD